MPTRRRTAQKKTTREEMRGVNFLFCFNFARAKQVAHTRLVEPNFTHTAKLGKQKFEELFKLPGSAKTFCRRSERRLFTTFYRQHVVRRSHRRGLSPSNLIAALRNIFRRSRRRQSNDSRCRKFINISSIMCPISTIKATPTRKPFCFTPNLCAQADA